MRKGYFHINLTGTRSTRAMSLCGTELTSPATLSLSLSMFLKINTSMVKRHSNCSYAFDRADRLRRSKSRMVSDDKPDASPKSR